MPTQAMAETDAEIKNHSARSQQKENKGLDKATSSSAKPYPDPGKDTRRAVKVEEKAEVSRPDQSTQEAIKVARSEEILGRNAPPN
jgi:hypothetical protein